MILDMRRRCPVCENNNGKSLGILENTVSYPINRSFHPLLECDHCATIYLDAVLDKHDLKVLYEDAVQFTSPAYRDEDHASAALRYYGNCYRNMVRLIGGMNTKIRVLEVGAGLAWVCRSAKLNGDVFTVAQDITNECEQECTWVDKYIVGDVKSSNVVELGPYNIISLTHVIEHLTDPINVLKYLRTLISNNGCIFITAPCRPENWGSNDNIHKWRDWSYNHVPGHLQYFSKISMEHAASVCNLRLSSWSLHENGQAFEAVLTFPD